VLELNIASNIKQFERRLNDIEKRQLPFATAQALTATAFDVRKQIVERTFPEAFEVKNKRFIGAAMRVKKATKQTLVASVFDRLGRAQLKKHTTGGIKTPRGNNIAIPGRALKRGKSGGITKANRPRQLLDKANVVKLRSKSGQDMIARRNKKGRLEVLYILEPSANIKKSFRFYEDARTVVKKNMPTNFKKSWRRALATARK